MRATHILTLALLLALPLVAQQAHYGRHHGVPLPDPKVTPGQADSALTKAKLCDPDFHTAAARNVPLSEKKQVCAAYGAKNCPKAELWEIDHLISIELGGSNSQRNLWPQKAPWFQVKDVLENRLHAMVCGGQMSLPDAQRCIAQDWVACALQVGSRTAPFKH
jgi:hypothetical protein